MVEFTEEQVRRVDEIYDKIRKMMGFMIDPEAHSVTLYEEKLYSDAMEMADIVAEAMVNMGYSVYFPTLVEGAEEVSDYYL